MTPICGTCRFFEKYRERQGGGFCMIKLPPWVAKQPNAYTGISDTCDLHRPQSESTFIENKRPVSPKILENANEVTQ